MNYVSYSLWGTDARYCYGAIRNAQLVNEKYGEGWCPLFYCGSDVNGRVIQSLVEEGAEVVQGMDYFELSIPGMFWRMLAIDRSAIVLGGDVDRVIIRDADSRITDREVDAVNQWIESGKTLHTMRDHPAHARPINGGMWGIKAGAIDNLIDHILDWNPNEDYGDDQAFLCRVVWPMFKKDCLQHDSVSRHFYKDARQFPSARNGSYRFVGEVYEVQPVDGQWKEFTRDFDSVQIDPWKD